MLVIDVKGDLPNLLLSVPTFDAEALAPTMGPPKRPMSALPLERAAELAEARMTNLVAAHTRSALLSVQRTRHHAASGRLSADGLLSVGLTTDRELHRAVVAALDAAALIHRDHYDLTSGIDADEDDETEDDEEPAESTDNHLCMIQVGLMSRRDEMAAGAVCQAYLDRLLSGAGQHGS